MASRYHSTPSTISNGTARKKKKEKPMSSGHTSSFQKLTASSTSSVASSANLLQIRHVMFALGRLPALRRRQEYTG
jgi:hypothetical protein